MAPNLDHVDEYDSNKIPKPKCYYYVIKLNHDTIYKLAWIHEIRSYHF
jgi:hypothetical protein